jgi:hypothetical protein
MKRLRGCGWRGKCEKIFYRISVKDKKNIGICFRIVRGSLPKLKGVLGMSPIFQGITLVLASLSRRLKKLIKLQISLKVPLINTYKKLSFWNGRTFKCKLR